MRSRGDHCVEFRIAAQADDIDEVSAFQGGEADLNAANGALPDYNDLRLSGRTLVDDEGAAGSLGDNPGDPAYVAQILSATLRADGCSRTTA